MFSQKDRLSSAKTSPSRWIIVRALLDEKSWSEHPNRGAANKLKASSRTGMNTGQQPSRIAFIPSAQSLTHLRDK